MLLQLKWITWLCSWNITITDDIYGAQASAPYYGWRRKTFRFAVGSGIANENLNEVGIGWDTIEGAYLATRALIVDISGNTNYYYSTCR